ncbi:hypothetical protein G7Z17_g3564 [Cylindrodendrum hubeiense]|uniref:Uncharacterized protein n=1 Tax=Cylindrodendrum hubeiense TaxID=595255 RepID=A0A9P5HEH9_9HYPO|nr:hypothetical protein G7Z17_g3564 [Cylindrodendrum hubeiense]
MPSGRVRSHSWTGHAVQDQACEATTGASSFIDTALIETLSQVVTRRKTARKEGVTARKEGVAAAHKARKIRKGAAPKTPATPIPPPAPSPSPSSPPASAEPSYRDISSQGNGPQINGPYTRIESKDTSKTTTIYTNKLVIINNIYTTQEQQPQREEEGTARRRRAAGSRRRRRRKQGRR